MRPFANVEDAPNLSLNLEDVPLDDLRVESVLLQESPPSFKGNFSYEIQPADQEQDSEPPIVAPSILRKSKLSTSRSMPRDRSQSIARMKTRDNISFENGSYPGSLADPDEERDIESSWTNIDRKLTAADDETAHEDPLNQSFRGPPTQSKSTSALQPRKSTALPHESRSLSGAPKGLRELAAYLRSKRMSSAELGKPSSSEGVHVLPSPAGIGKFSSLNLDGSGSDSCSPPHLPPSRMAGVMSAEGFQTLPTPKQPPSSIPSLVAAPQDPEQWAMKTAFQTNSHSSQGRIQRNRIMSEAGHGDANFNSPPTRSSDSFMAAGCPPRPPHANSTSRVLTQTKSLGRLQTLPSLQATSDQPSTSYQPSKSSRFTRTLGDTLESLSKKVIWIGISRSSSRQSRAGDGQDEV